MPNIFLTSYLETNKSFISSNRFIEQLSTKRREVQESQGTKGSQQAPKSQPLPNKPTSLSTGMFIAGFIYIKTFVHLLECVQFYDCDYNYHNYVFSLSRLCSHFLLFSLSWLCSLFCFVFTFMIVFTFSMGYFHDCVHILDHSLSCLCSHSWPFILSCLCSLSCLCLLSWSCSHWPKNMMTSHKSASANWNQQNLVN